VTRVIVFALETPGLAGPANVVAPNPVTNSQFTRLLGRALRRPALLRVPTLALRLVFGEMAEATILESQRVLPSRLSALGFDFEYPELEAGLRAMLR
jgi:NAD dependent epimerase/dehydratase family enzyme